MTIKGDMKKEKLCNKKFQLIDEKQILSHVWS